MHYIAFDSHKHYTVASIEKPEEKSAKEFRIEHGRGTIEKFLSNFDPGSPVAVETIGNWYWIVDEIEKAGMLPQLVHARKAKLMMGSINKTDKLDARGLNLLQRNGTLPTVWIPTGELRDQRDIPRTRMMLSRERTRLKNRIHASLTKYALNIQGASDTFGKAGRLLIRQKIEQLPPHTQFATLQVLEQLEVVEDHIKLFEQRIKDVFAKTPEMELIMSIPGVGYILGVVLMLEIGDITRFHSAAHLASYAGTTPRIHSSGDKTRYGQLRSDVNRYLKWAYAEAANTISLHRRLFPDRHVNLLYNRVARRKGHQKAIGAVARHLAEATYWILTKKECYREPTSRAVSLVEA
jgi:transposase